MTARYTDQHPQFTVFDADSGNFAPNADGEVEFFTVGNTGVANRKDTYSDPALTTPNPNPVPLDDFGRSIVPIFLKGSYNTIIRDKDDVQQDQVDNVSGGSESTGVPALTVQNVADLRDVDTLSFQEAYVLGTSTLRDGGQGNFIYISGSSESDNGVDVIEPNIGGGRWLLDNNRHNSFRYEQASGSVDAFTINPTPFVTSLDKTKVYYVQSLGPNTITGVTFTVGTGTTLPLQRDNSNALQIGDNGPAGYQMIIKTNEAETAYVLVNPFKVGTNNLVDGEVTQDKLAKPSVGTPELIDDSVNNNKLNNMPANTMKANFSGSTANPSDENQSAVRGFVFPIGLISMWSGTLASIPAEWSLCDGSNGTPDLRDRFVLSVGAAENPGSTGGDTDGQSNNTSSTSAGTPSGSVTVAPHQLTVAEIPSHTHDTTLFTNVGGFGPDRAPVGGNSGSTINTGATGGNGAHGHTGSTFSGSALPGHQHTYNSNFPSYFKLAFIMFTG